MFNKKRYLIYVNIFSFYKLLVFCIRNHFKILNKIYSYLKETASYNLNLNNNLYKVLLGNVFSFHYLTV